VSLAHDTMTAVIAIMKVPTGQSAPFARLTDDDHRPWIIIAAAVGVSFTMLALISQTFIRFFVLAGWGLDDSLTVASTVSTPDDQSALLVSLTGGSGFPSHSIFAGHGRLCEWSRGLRGTFKPRKARASSTGESRVYRLM
jgi:hypothetical protein